MPLHRAPVETYRKNILGETRPTKKQSNPPDVLGRGGMTLLEPRLRTTGADPLYRLKPHKIHQA
jgi:hypothetical protein